MKDKLVVFVTDRGFLVPSLVAARQLIGFGVTRYADIIIYTIGVDPAVIETLNQAYVQQGLRLEPLNTESFMPADHATFRRNHVPVSTLARLSLDQVINPAYQNIIYIDGDVQVIRNPESLIRYVVPEGKILAGRGSAWLDGTDGSDSKEATAIYLSNLGGVLPQHYFNAGVLAFRRSTWMEKGPEALAFFNENSAACVRHDQSALNAVFCGQVVNFAPQFNFHSIYAELYVQRRYAPSIIHFTGPNKPWNYSGSPWWGRFNAVYADFMTAHPELSDYLDIYVPQISRPKALVREARRLLRDRSTVMKRRRAFFDYITIGDFAV